MVLGELCMYCGSDSEIQRDHVIPAAYFGYRTYNDTEQWIVPACSTCNLLAGSRVFFSIPDKARYISVRYRKKFRKVLRIPNWTPDEIKQMSYKFRVSIEQSLIAKTILQRRLQYVEAVADYPKNYFRPKWIEKEYKIWLEREKERMDWEKKFRQENYGKKKTEA